MNKIFVWAFRKIKSTSHFRKDAKTKRCEKKKKGKKAQQDSPAN